MRNTFQEQLEQLNVELIKMGALCEEAISAATKAYLEGDRELGQRTGRLEQEIDNKERDIEGQCMKLLLRQQPVAGDLRTVSAAMRMISDLSMPISGRSTTRSVALSVQRRAGRVWLATWARLSPVISASISSCRARRVAIFIISRRIRMVNSSSGQCSRSAS